MWVSVISRADDIDAALDEVTIGVRDALDGPPDLVFVFASEHFHAHYEALPSRVQAALGDGALVGCSAGGVIGGGREVEFAPALAVLAGRMPGLHCDYWHLDSGDLAPGSAHSETLARIAHELDGQPAQLVVLADPFTFPAEQMLRSLESGFGRAVICGGLASGGQAPGQLALFAGPRTYRSGALVLSLRGDVRLNTAVAQGCRPIGEPLFLTAADGATIAAVDGRSPLAVLQDLYAAAGTHDRELMQQSLFIGLAMRAGDADYRRGDFLIRNLVGADERSGTIRVAADLHPNQVVQFHLRDAETSADDLRQVLERTRSDLGAATPTGALLFSCTGRGEGLYGRSGHDSGIFDALFGACPLAGFFCNGEIGPVQGVTYLHGYTSAFAMFTPSAATDP